MSYQIDLQRDITAHTSNAVHGTRIKITVTGASGLSPKIFVYREIPLNPNDETKVAQFDHVASPSDLEDFPEDAPVSGSDPPWFRLNVVDVIVRSRTIAEEFWVALFQDVTELKNTLERLDTFDDQTTFIVGDGDVGPSGVGSGEAVPITATVTVGDPP
jgi:hypothetical protein